MTKFNRVLSESDADLMGAHLANEIGFDNVTTDLIRIFCLGVDWAEQAVLERLAEQKPIMFARTYGGEIDWDERCVTKRDDGELLEGLTDVNENGDVVAEEGYAVIPLYAHPMPPTEQKPIGYLHANGISFLSSRRTTAEQARAEDYNTPLYAHPCVSQNGRFEKHESQIPNGTLIGEGTSGAQNQSHAPQNQQPRAQAPQQNYQADTSGMGDIDDDIPFAPLLARNTYVIQEVIGND